MKSLLASVLALGLTSSSSAFASTTGSLLGNCFVENNQGVRNFSFEVASGDRQVLGLLVADDTYRQVEVINNLGVTGTLGLAMLSVGRTDRDVTLVPPQVLCPTFPEAAKIACEQQNKENEAKRPAQPSTEGFQTARPQGLVNEGFLGDHVYADGLENGQALKLEAVTYETKVSCVATFQAD